MQQYFQGHISLMFLFLRNRMHNLLVFPDTTLWLFSSVVHFFVHQNRNAGSKRKQSGLPQCLLSSLNRLPVDAGVCQDWLVGHKGSGAVAAQRCFRSWSVTSSLSGFPCMLHRSNAIDTVRLLSRVTCVYIYDIGLTSAEKAPEGQ